MDQVGFIDQQPVEAMGYAHVLEKCIWRHETIAQRVDQVTMGRHHDVATELAARHALTKKLVPHCSGKSRLRWSTAAYRHRFVESVCGLAAPSREPTTCTQF